MKTKNKTILALVLVAGLSLLGYWGFNSTQTDNQASVVSTQNADVVKIRVADLPVVHALPMYIAMEKGYFDEAGIEIEYIKLDSPNLIIDALLSGQVDMTSPSGAMGISGIASYRQPNTIEIYVATGGNEDIRTEGLMVREDSSIKSFSDLKGKKMGILPGIQWRTISQHLLSQHGLEVDKDVMLVELAPGLQVSALYGGQIDALLAIEPMTTIAEKVGMIEVDKSPNLEAIANPFYPGAGILRSDFADQNPESVEKFIGALERALVDIESNPDEARQYLARYTPLDEELIAVAPIMHTKLYKDFTEEDMRAIEDFHRIFTTYGVIEGEIDTRGMIYQPRQ
jgi:NitT/TauT family transport system substrate-binding protein